MKKTFTKISVVVMLVVLAALVSMFFVGCEEEPEEPVFEIRLYDDNWQELKRQGNQNFAIYEDYVVKYDGTPKLCNAIVYRNGEIFYQLDYKKRPDFYIDKCLQLCIKYDALNVVITNNFPCDVGEYNLVYQYNSDGYYYNMKYFAGNPLPSKYYHDSETVKLIIQE